MTDRPERIESILAAHRRAPAPEGLRERLLRTLEARKRRERIMTPGLWKAAAASLILAAVTVAGDLLMTDIERARLSTAIDGPTEVRTRRRSAVSSDDQVLAEVLTAAERQLLTQLSQPAIRSSTRESAGGAEWLRLELGLFEENDNGD